MKKTGDHIQQGMIESYVLGLITPSEAKEVERMAAANNEVRAEIDEFSKILEEHALSDAVLPDPGIKPVLMAAINNYIKNGR